MNYLKETEQIYTLGLLVVLNQEVVVLKSWLVISGVLYVMCSGGWLMLKLPVVIWATEEPYKPLAEDVSTYV